MSSSTYERVKEWRARPEAKAMRAAQARRWRAKHPEKAAEIKQRYRMSDIENIREKEAKQASDKRRNDPEGQRLRVIKWRAKKEAALTAAAGRPRPSVCDICGLSSRQICFDHCHVSGQFRGWLCDRCNKVLGLVYDSPELLLKLRDYLKGAAHGETHQQAEKQTA